MTNRQDIRIYPHLSAAAEAVVEGTLAVGDEFATPARKKSKPYTVADVEGTLVFVPFKGGECLTIDYCLGAGRVAIERTAAMHSNSVLASLRDQRLDVHLGIITRAEFDRRIVLTEAGGISVPDDVKAPIA